MVSGKYIDLHLHLDGAVTPAIAEKLAAAQGIQIPHGKELERALTVSEDCKSLDEFLKCFALPGSLMQTKEGLSEATRLVADDLKRQGVIYAEIRYAPQLHTLKGMTAEDAVKAALEGLERTDLKANLILCCMRGMESEEGNRETLRLAEKYLVRDGGVVGMDLAGSETMYPMEKYAPLLTEAAKRGIPLTVHAGEAGGAENVRLAVKCGASRIGHGVRAYGDTETEQMLTEKGIFTELCPTSNIQTHAVENMADYPLIPWLERGIRVTLNTDDPAIEGTTIAKEFSFAENSLGLTEEHRKALLSNSVSAAFTTDEVKEKLKKELGI